MDVLEFPCSLETCNVRVGRSILRNEYEFKGGDKNSF